MDEVLYPFDRYPRLEPRGVPGQPVTPATVYPGCLVFHSDGWVGVSVGFDDNGDYTVNVDGEIKCAPWSSEFVIATGSTPSVIGVGEWAVTREGRVLKAVELIDLYSYPLCLLDVEEATMRWVSADGDATDDDREDGYFGIASVHTTAEAARAWRKAQKREGSG